LRAAEGRKVRRSNIQTFLINPFTDRFPPPAYARSMENTPPPQTPANWRKLVESTLIILALTFVAASVWAARTWEVRGLALAALVVLAVAAVHVLTEPKKIHPLLRSSR
jgi:hypothetical protein